MVLAADYPFLDILWTMLVFFGWVIWFWLLISVFSDLFSRHDISGWGKAGWIVLVVVLPYLGVFIYLIAQGEQMAERKAQQSQAARAEFDDYVKTVAAPGGAGRRDREGQAAARQRRHHPSGVRRDQGKGARLEGPERRHSLCLLHDMYAKCRESHRAGPGSSAVTAGA